MKKILLIDDDIQIRKMMKQKLERKGYQVETAVDGKEGENFFRNDPADLVITDLIMPEKDGIETITELRKEFPDIKIIAISGGGQLHPDMYLKIAKNIGADYTFRKPVEMDKLFDAVKEIIG